MLPRRSPTSAARLPHAACGPVCAELVRPVQCGCAQQKFSSPNLHSRGNESQVLEANLRLDRRLKAIYGANHLQGVFPCRCSPRRVARNSLHYLRKYSNGNPKYSTKPYLVVRLPGCYPIPSTCHRYCRCASLLNPPAYPACRSALSQAQKASHKHSFQCGHHSTPLQPQGASAPLGSDDHELMWSCQPTI